MHVVSIIFAFKDRYRYPQDTQQALMRIGILIVLQTVYLHNHRR